MPRGIFSCFRHRTSTTSSTSSSSPDPTPIPIPIPTGPGPVLVELFTSQGCSTSPSAELLFSRIGRGDFSNEVPAVVILAYHVDYWDYNGWKDRFGSSQWTVRQKEYVEMFNLDTMFTPHVVVQGVKQCIGYEEDEVMECIKGVARYPSPAFEATFERPTPESLQITLKGALRAKLDGVGADIMVALCESGLVTDCQDGVNKDRMLANDFVVRKLTKLCSIENLPPKKIITGSLECDLWQGFNGTKCGIVVFVQQHGTRHIFGSQRIPLPADI